MRHEYWNRQTLDSEFSVFLFTVLGSECWGSLWKRGIQTSNSLFSAHAHFVDIFDHKMNTAHHRIPGYCSLCAKCPYTFTTPKTFAVFYGWLETLTGNMNQKTALCDRLSWSLGILLEANPHNKDTPGMFSWVCMHGSDPVSGLCSAEFGKLKAAVECEIARRWNGHHYLYERDSSSSGRDTAHHFITEFPNELMRDDKHQQVSSHSSIRELWYSHLWRRQKRHSIQSWVGFE